MNASDSEKLQARLQRIQVTKDISRANIIRVVENPDDVETNLDNELWKSALYLLMAGGTEQEYVAMMNELGTALHIYDETFANTVVAFARKAALDIEIAPLIKESADREKEEMVVKLFVRFKVTEWGMNSTDDEVVMMIDSAIGESWTKSAQSRRVQIIEILKARDLWQQMPVNTRAQSNT